MMSTSYLNKVYNRKLCLTCLERSIAWSVSSIVLLPAWISSWFDISTQTTIQINNEQIKKLINVSMLFRVKWRV